MQSSGQWRILRSAAEVWHVCPHALPAEMLERRWLGRLSPPERARVDQLQFARLRHVYLAGRALCRATLSRYAGVDPAAWSFVENAWGKPAIAGPAEFARLRFNLTHTDGLVACLVSRVAEVGVDAEETSRAVDVDSVARHFFSERERAVLNDVPPARRARKFHEYWVVKEAYLKGLGAGLSLPPEQVSIEWDADGQPLPRGDWQLALHHVGARHVAATAVRSGLGSEAVPIRWRVAEDLL